MKGLSWQCLTWKELFGLCFILISYVKHCVVTIKGKGKFYIGESDQIKLNVMSSCMAMPQQLLEYCVYLGPVLSKENIVSSGQYK